MTSGVTTAYVHIAHDQLCEHTGTTYTDYIYVNGRMVTKQTGSDIYYYIRDALGCTRMVYSGTSQVFSLATYAPFGTPNGASGTEKVKYAGEIQDSSTGLYIFARYMDPELGRFISLDPELGRLSSPQTQNRYVYCVNNPLRFTGPTGEWFGVSLKTIEGGLSSFTSGAIMGTAMVAAIYTGGATAFAYGAGAAVPQLTTVATTARATTATKIVVGFFVVSA